MNKEQKELVKELNDYDEENKYEVVKRAEYPTLLINGREITQGSVEVTQRLKVLKRELGIF
jgi:hypothetical protein